MLLSLQKGIIYGPVNSRRLGLSLGINLMPGTYKLCSFNCIYCHYGWTDKQALDLTPFAGDFPGPDDVAEAVEEALVSDTPFDYITFSGNGEATIHPDFPKIVTAVKKLRDRHRPQARLALLSNSTGLINDRVRESIADIDLPVMKLDAGTETCFRAINRPPKSITLQMIVDRLRSLPNLHLQTVFLSGNPDNTTIEELDAYFEHLRQLTPVQVHIYSIDRPVPGTNISLVSPERLETIAREGREKTGVDIVSFYPRRD